MGFVTAQCVTKAAGGLLRPVEAGTGGLLQDNKAHLTKLHNHEKQGLHRKISSVYFFLI